MKLQSKHLIGLLSLLGAFVIGVVLVIPSKTEVRPGVKDSLATPSANVYSQKGSSLGRDFDTYVNGRFNFSVAYPKGAEILEYDEGDDAFTILVNSFKGSQEESFQVFIYPVNIDEGLLTPQVIRHDNPDAVIEDAQYIELSGDVRALLFWSEDSFIGKTRELWFVHSGYMYQVTTYAESDSWLAKIMSTWTFL